MCIYVCVLPNKCVRVVVKARSYRRRYLGASRTPGNFEITMHFAAFKAQFVFVVGFFQRVKLPLNQKS